jgi:predicted ATPase
MVEEGEGKQGIAQLHQGLAAYQAIGAKLILASGCYMLADAYKRIGHAQQGLEALAQALALVQKHGEHFWEAELHRLKGDLLLLQSTSHQTQAEACFQTAIHLARRQQAKSLELRATKSLTILWCQQGKKKQARSMLEALYGWFQEGFDTADLRGVKALLEVLKR